MIVLAGIVLAVVLVFAVLAIAQRTRARDVATSAHVALDRAERRLDAHTVWLKEVARSAERVYHPAPGTDSTDQNPTPTAPIP